MQNVTHNMQPTTDIHIQRCTVPHHVQQAHRINAARRAQQPRNVRLERHGDNRRRRSIPAVSTRLHATRGAQRPKQPRGIDLRRRVTSAPEWESPAGPGGGRRASGLDDAMHCALSAGRSTSVRRRRRAACLRVVSRAGACCGAGEGHFATRRGLLPESVSTITSRARRSIDVFTADEHTDSATCAGGAKQSKARKPTRDRVSSRGLQWSNGSKLTIRLGVGTAAGQRRGGRRELAGGGLCVRAL